MSEPAESPSVSAASLPQPEDLAEQLGQLWEQGRRPDVDAFLAQAGPLSPATLAAVLRVDQRGRWRAGERVPAEAYLQRYPALQTDADAACVGGITATFSGASGNGQSGERQSGKR